MRLLNRLAVVSALTVVNCASTAAQGLQKLSLKDAEQSRHSESPADTGLDR